MAKQIIKGDDLMLFDSTGKSIGYATAHTLTLSAEAQDVSSKDHGIWTGNEVNKISWEITSENLYTTEEFDALFSAMIAREGIIVYFGTKTAAQDKTVADDDFNAWSLAPTANVPDGASEAVGSYSATGSAAGTAGYKGKVFITNLQANANTGENATFSVTLTGSGKIEKLGN